MKKNQIIYLCLIIIVFFIISFFYKYYKVNLSLQIIFTLILFFVKPKIIFKKINLFILIYIVTHMTIYLILFEPKHDLKNTPAAIMILIVGGLFSYCLTIIRFLIMRKR